MTLPSFGSARPRLSISMRRRKCPMTTRSLGSLSGIPGRREVAAPARGEDSGLGGSRGGRRG
eukprot:14431834-Alexandrium_andersonii.AAC.1